MRRNLKPVDLARAHGISAQAVRNHERDGFLPPAGRTPGGHRIYTAAHAAALRAFLALSTAFGRPVAAAIMVAVNAGRLEQALALVDDGHEQLRRDRATLAAVRSAVEHLEPAADGEWTVGEVARHLRITPATVRAWEEAGILRPARAATGHRVYDASDRRDAELTHLLRRGGHPLDRIAEVVAQVRGAGDRTRLAEALRTWQERSTARGRAMLAAAAALDAYLSL